MAMSILEHAVRSGTDVEITDLCPVLFSQDQYYTMASAGAFDSMRVELIEG